MRVEPGDIVFDVGAYIGMTSRVAARHAEHVFAIEPSPRARASLAKNTEEYENIEIVSCAVSDKNSEMDLQFGNDITDDSLIDPDDGGSGETVTVPVKTIEQLANDLDVPTIDFLKVEAEGLEPEVVRGAIGAPVKRIAVAGNDERYGETTFEEVLEILRGAGFDVNTNSEDLPYNMVYGIRSEYGG